MNLKDFARQLPDKYRRQLLEDNIIYKAIARVGDVHMKMLLIYWSHYMDTISPIDEQCNICLNEILKKYKDLEPIFVELEKEYQLLEL